VADLILAGVPMEQADIVKMGGITGMLCCTALAQAHGAEFVPHQTHRRSATWRASISPPRKLLAVKPCELNDPSPRMHAVFSNPPRPVEDLFYLPTAPGLGLDIDEAALAQRRVALPGH
jgi:L-alanine-DL-glutamate epimerase-like enolase superfamily enzyme